jgi:DNA-binding CsgD family transcriptional regulator
MTDSRDIAAAWQGLTPMQRAVAMLVRDGLCDKAIADRLRISVRGTRYHMDRLRLIFNCDSKLSLAVATERAIWALSLLTPSQNERPVENLRP